MINLLCYAALGLWGLSLVLAVINWKTVLCSHISVVIGSFAMLIFSVMALVGGEEVILLPEWCVLTIPALWLLFFGQITTCCLCWLGSRSQREGAKRFWLIGLTLSLIGAFGVFAIQHSMAFLIAWELMSLGGGVMVLAERLGKKTDEAVFFMLGLLEVGAVFLLLAIVTFVVTGGSLFFGQFGAAGAQMDPLIALFMGLLFLFGFGAKLGLLPFYEWFPEGYGSGSGASGALFSGLILNAALFALARALFTWLPLSDMNSILGMIIVMIGVLGAIMPILFGYQQTDWRKLLSLSSAENASISVLLLGIAVLFCVEGDRWIGGMALVIAFLHMAAHSLAKGALFLTADTVYKRTGEYAICQIGLLKKAPWLSIGALMAAMSLAGIPPQSGFLSEWYTFQTIFHGFKLVSLSGRLVLTLAGAGLALSSAIAIASFVKLYGVGLMGKGGLDVTKERDPKLIFMLGMGVLALAVGMPFWIRALSPLTESWLGVDVVSKMHTGWLMVPLSKQFAFSSPPMLVIVLPLFALVPLIFLWCARRFPIRRERVWFGGRIPFDEKKVAMTPIVFSNGLRGFYRLIYKPTVHVQKESRGRSYFTTSVTFHEAISPLFSRILFWPVVKVVSWISSQIVKTISGDINLYNAVIGVIALLAMLSVFLW